jgi:predicted ATPase
MLFIERVSVHDVAPDSWPFIVPAIGKLAEGMRFTAPLTFLVGENGSGKSTIIEAIAQACKISSSGGKAGTKYAVADQPTLLGDALSVDFTTAGRRWMTGPRRNRAGFFLRAETLFNLETNLTRMPPAVRYGFWEADLSSLSHGEGFHAVFAAMFKDAGIYLMDEPEAALSFLSCLSLAERLHNLATTGSQIICATHSPILAATPRADIIELDQHGFRHTTWDQLQLVTHWRHFLAKPGQYLSQLNTDDQNDDTRAELGLGR